MRLIEVAADPAIGPVGKTYIDAHRVVAIEPLPNGWGAKVRLGLRGGVVMTICSADAPEAIAQKVWPVALGG